MAFLIVILIALPAMDFFILKLKVEIIKLPIFERENTKMRNEIIEYFKEPEFFKVFNKIERATVSWPADYIKSIMITSK